ncbi:NADPH2:quinone reductase [Nocardiopsis sp. Huas11]|uniref:zinc-binding dehydrogenase n=1 Tax=Nocardiopsis sp. Huas11 TaxID=2183912 RepID=UPI000EB4454A|nr:zinc-binding dehydrogenase [Nocardiopsis sp. Huas11]RKS07134.1 NADPH2:quinone reductase [Nocardiopsis sp. Huas11]
MRFIEVGEFGAPEVLAVRQGTDPVPEAGQVALEVSVADVIFLETAIRRGEAGEWFGIRPPYVPGGGAVGTVTAVGAGVDPSWIGRRVATTAAQGSYAERTLAPADQLAAVPDGLDARTAAALVHDGATARSLVTTIAPKPDQWVLVTAAAGAMGLLLVQMAREAGARVVGAARGERKLELLRSRGIEGVVDYSEPGWTERVREAAGGRGPEVVYDGAGGAIGREAFAITASGGRFSAHGAPSGDFAEIAQEEADERGVTLYSIADLHQDTADATRSTEEVLAAAAAGRILPVIGQVFPLERAAEAHAALEERTILGKALLEVSR